MMWKTAHKSKGMRCWSLAILSSLGLLLVQPSMAMAASSAKKPAHAPVPAAGKHTQGGESSASSAESVTEVQGISVHGTDEFPKVFNIVPWQTPTLTLRARPKLKADMPDLLTPVDPQVFGRQRKFRNTLHLLNPQQGMQF